MACFRTTIAFNQRTVMTESVNSTERCSKSKNKKSPNTPNHLSVRSAAVDVAILIAVVSASGFLLFPSIKLLILNFFEIVREIVDLVGEEVSQAPLFYGFFWVSILCASVSLLAITVFASRRCGDSGCRGLRKAAEFDIQIETEECVVKNSSNLGRDCVKKGLFELQSDRHRELEAELKKMAPPNGRVVLVLKARCGCSVGRMEVWGMKKPRKVKK
ncbi:Ribosomal protein L34Ae protein [Actinidia chinensis var. chinensis]|uniref:Ribosomal protein L34Ae protein n=1 Tax=Actinidia chinensis var. chinensis TaxID=1590841 RepID=A0A2R6RYN6_ACTCC|nr:Ribosomal protein L34Ae protein [Actinidia chinensis var. chinensis]